MKNLIFIVFLLFVGIKSQAQITVMAKIDTVASAIYADNLDQIYLLMPSDELLKYDNKGNLKWRYSNNRYGKLHRVDVSDPMRILLFYADFQQVVVLNNNLNEIGSYSFANNSSLLVSELASANNNGFWAFDNASNSLIKLSSNFIEEVRSISFFQLFDTAISPKKLAANDQYVYLQTKNNEVLQFDRFGAFIKNLDTDSLSDFSITKNEIAYHQKNKLVKFHPITGVTNIKVLPIALPIKQVAVGNKLITVLTEKAVFLLSDN